MAVRRCSSLCRYSVNGGEQSPECISCLIYTSPATLLHHGQKENRRFRGSKSQQCHGEQNGATNSVKGGRSIAPPGFFLFLFVGKWCVAIYFQLYGVQNVVNCIHISTPSLYLPSSTCSFLNTRLRNDLYCVEWDVKLLVYNTISQYILVICRRSNSFRGKLNEQCIQLFF